MVFAEVFGDPFDQEYWDQNNPLVLAKGDNLEDLAIYFDYGTADRYDAQIQMGQGLRRLDGTLTEAGVTHEFRVHEGEPHGWAVVVAHADESFGFLARHFGE